MDDESKKALEELYNEVGYVPKDVGRGIIMSLLSARVDAIERLLVDKGIITEEDLNESLRKSMKKQEESISFVNKLARGQ